MKYSTIVLLFLFMNAGAQADLQFLKIKNADRTVDLSVINHSETKYEIQVNIELVGMKFNNNLPLQIMLAAKEKRKIGQLSPTGDLPGKYVISYKAVDAGNPSYAYVPNMTIYTKNKHKRSTQLLIFLEENGIAYNEINVSYNGDTKEMYSQMLKRRALTTKDAKLPVIIYKGEVYADIKKVPTWCKTHLSEEGHFIRKKDRKY